MSNRHEDACIRKPCQASRDIAWGTHRNLLGKTSGQGKASNLIISGVRRLAILYDLKAPALLSSFNMFAGRQKRTMSS